MFLARKLHPLSAVSSAWLLAGMVSLVPQANGASQADDFTVWQSQQNKTFLNSRSAQDREFAQFLKGQWEEMQAFRGEVRDATPKPKLIPIALPGSASAPPHPKPEVSTVPTETKTSAPPVVSPFAKGPPSRSSTIKFDYFGEQVTLPVDNHIRAVLKGSPSPVSISDWWTAMSASTSHEFLAILATTSKRLKLDDWGYVLLIRAAAKELHPSSVTNQHLLTWFVLSKAGYQARIGYSSSTVALLLPTQQRVYAFPYVVINGIRHYALFDKGNSETLYTYQGSYSDNARHINFLRRGGPALPVQPVERTLSFTYHGKNYSYDLVNDANLQRYLDTFPTIELNNYFASLPPDSPYELLRSKLRNSLTGMQQRDQIEFLLRFVQTAFIYRTDSEQFAREKYLFAEETLYYPYSDCEDRSILFAHLVKDLVGTEVIGLSWPGHVATAVRVGQKHKGDIRLIHNGQEYLVADPTYVGAAVGEAMPQFAAVKPNVIYGP